MTTPAPLTPAQLARIRETIRPTIEDWLRDYETPRDKSHGQLENRLVAAIEAMHQGGVLTINQINQGPKDRKEEYDFRG